MNFTDIQKLSGLLAKSFAEDFLKLLVNYQTISASEAASRLNLHIKTVQDFLEGLCEVGYLSKEEIIDKKRPYFRYQLVKQAIEINFDINSLIDDRNELLEMKIREQNNSNCLFNVSPKTNEIASITFFVGEGRAKKERKIQLTKNQSKFLFHLPFPTAVPKKVLSIIEENHIEKESTQEIFDLLLILKDNGVIEMLE
ncbi:MAG: hypothetical protein JXQ65_13010 [Candidatus Marinimicrobia bacterium]|nr:hypothetical protein [Candidatus Neomarinimicrobiota bacterium]